MAAAPERDLALDGLRGLVALVVVAGHILDVNGAFVDTERGASVASVGSWTWWLHSTPLGLPVGGSGAVVPVFFVLSGFVLCFPLMRGTTLALWAGYYPRRALRLYVPAIAAVLLAYVWQLGIHRDDEPGLSWWMRLHLGHVGPRNLVRDSALFLPVDGLDTALWSLRYEITFSALLPLFYFAATRARNLWWLKIAACAVVIGFGTAVGNPWLRYMPGFLLGCVLAAERKTIVGPLERMSDGARWALAGLGVVLLLARSLVQQGSIPPSDVLAACAGISGLGALLLLALVVCKRSPVRRLCEARVLAGPAKYAFSLYLVHEPLVVSFAYLLGGHPNPVLLFATAYPASLIVAWVFFRVVEDPATRLSRNVGTATKRRVRTFQHRHDVIGPITTTDLTPAGVSDPSPVP